MASNTDLDWDGKSFAERLKVVMAGQKLSDFANDIGVKYQNVQRYLRGAQPGAAFLQRLVTRKNVSLEWLLTGIGVPQPPLQEAAAEHGSEYANLPAKRHADETESFSRAMTEFLEHPTEVLEAFVSGSAGQMVRAHAEGRVDLDDDTIESTGRMCWRAIRAR